MDKTGLRDLLLQRGFLMLRENKKSLADAPRSTKKQLNTKKRYAIISSAIENHDKTDIIITFPNLIVHR